jgi:ribosomal protein L28
MGIYPSRKHCELCGKKLEEPETNSRKVAMCKKCVKGNLLSFALRNGKW